ncbi:uncharacterized protein LOC124721873 [Schistocerca piceifrons]|uniref:uncharacterized protein LOC124721873 n=1 Tax=Schistocerca piceifrons TaxID=274613 RepID=UPI001F5E8F6B|nr:uncharacterized protein LOC124721873 [Schistocerca piceifrons]XP_047102968.1 uncharacterized protein LOC124721873 [Schistocerca piceifrons]XP_047102969.1 uncharacterized protein LOC124721873 [Schistocerca piceifrons]
MKGIFCVKCNYWFHEKCAKVNLKLIKDEFPWSCPHCLRMETAELVSTVNSKEEIIKLLQSDIEALKAEILALKQENSELVIERKSCVCRNQPITEQSGKHPHLCNTANNTTENSVSETSDKYKWKTVSYNKKGKRKSATNKEDDKNDFLLIGDSILKNVIVPDCKVDVRPGIRSHQLNKHFKNVLSTKRNTGEIGNKTLSTDDYRGVLIHVGTNSIRSNSEEEIVNETRNLIRSAKTVYPTARLVISGIIHRRSYYDGC